MPSTLSHQLAKAENWLLLATDELNCVMFELHRDKVGDLSFTYVSNNCKKLFRLSANELMSSFTLFVETLDPTDRLGLLEMIAVAAAKRVGFVWQGRQRAGRKQKSRWIRIQAKKFKAPVRESAWRGIITDISHEHEIETALKRSRDQLSELSSYLESDKEEERERIARDIHDELGSLLVALKIESALLTSKLPENVAGLREKSRAIENLLDQAMGTASRVARELRPGILKEFGLAAAIECQAEDFSQRTGISCRAQCEDDGLEIEEQCALAVFRIVQEALTNVAKHAHASLVALRLYRDHQQLIVEIRDNGRGIGDVDFAKPKSFGLRGIKERVKSLHGEVNIGPGETGGTHIILSVPMKQGSRRGVVDEDNQHKLF